MRCLLFITFCLLGFESPAQSDADYIKTIYTLLIILKFEFLIEENPPLTSITES